ncbi:MAG: AraC family transcriptional regulator [Paenibacillaceae bacterium]|nr:AraC family transcriptional regulator [Paenibacillaceae bacterium]
MQKAKRYIWTTPRELFLAEGPDLYMNRVEESFNLEEHTHEFIEFNYVMEGRGYQHIGDAVMEVAGGDLFYLPLGTSHVFRPVGADTSKNRLIVYNCLFGPELLESLASRGEEYRELLSVLGSLKEPCQPGWRQWKDRTGEIRRLFSAMLEDYVRRKPFGRLMLQARFVELLVQLHWQEEQERTERGPAEGGQDELVDKAVSWVREHSADRLTAAQAAVVAGLSERHFRRRFAARTGMSFLNYIHKLRIEQCCARLAASRDRVADIAAEAGFQDVKFFNRLFKKKTGMTPRQYRMFAAEAHGRTKP